MANPYKPKSDRVGETNRAKNGLMMTIIAYRNWSDIDVEFEDGVQVTHHTYQHFKEGTIAHPNIRAKKKISQDRVGATCKAKNGMLMKIIVYRSAIDIDIEFEDGAVAMHQTYRHFQEGKIKHPDPAKRAIRKPNISVGEKNMAKCGLEMTIIKIYSYNNLDIQFEDGVIVQGKTYTSFISGNIAHPGISTILRKYQDAHIGETRENTKGSIMTIIEYFNCNDITVKFDDGTVVKHRTYGAFVNGYITNPNMKSSHIGESIVNVQGIPMRLIRWGSRGDVDIQYETGCVLEHKYYANFALGIYRHPFPYTLGNITLYDFAYKHNNICNFYCTCAKCGGSDIMSLSEIKEHICNM